MPAAFGSAVVEVAIGLVFMYLLLSLIVTVVNELIAQALALRAKTLEQGLVRLLEGRSKTGDTAPTHDAPPRPAVTAQNVLNHPLILGMSALNGQSRPSYIPARQFALALIDIIAPDLDSKSPNYVAEFRVAVTNIQGNEHLKVALLALIDNATTKVEDLRTNIENWFDDAMDRVSGWYKRNVAMMGFLVGLGLTVLINADSLGVAQTLWINPSTRANVVSAAQDYVSKQPTPSPAPSSTPTFQQTETQLVSQIKSVETSQLPLGWTTFPPGGNDLARELFGLLLTAIAVSLGAPFWFDLLSMFVNVRNTGDPPLRSATAGPASVTSPAAGTASATTLPTVTTAPAATLPPPPPVAGP